MNETFCSKLIRWWNNPKQFIPEVWSGFLFNIVTYPRVSYFILLFMLGWLVLEFS